MQRPEVLACFQEDPVFGQYAVAFPVHLQDVDVMGEPVQQDSCQPFGSERLGPFVERQRRRCHSLRSNYMLNWGYAYTTIISSKYHGQTLFSHLASLYPHSTPQAWQQKLNNGEVTLNGVTATGSESVTLGQTLVWNRPPWIEPDSPQHFEVLFEDPHLLAVNKPSGLPTLPGGGFMENT